MTENWRPLPGREDFYEVSDLGRVRHKTDGRIVGESPGPGQVAVHLYRGGKHVRALLGRLVLQTFVGPCPEGMECCHNDGDFENNRLSNLRWGTKSENTLDSVKHGTHNNARKTRCPQGHEYTEENTYIVTRKSGPRKGKKDRICRTCKIDKEREKRST